MSFEYLCPYVGAALSVLQKTKTKTFGILRYNGFGGLRLIMIYFVSFTCKVIYKLSKYYLSATEAIFLKGKLNSNI